MQVAQFEEAKLRQLDVLFHEESTIHLTSFITFQIIKAVDDGSLIPPTSLEGPPEILNRAEIQTLNWPVVKILEFTAIFPSH
ncbi:hypothetical protein PHYBLDRAFT_151559 [Phycomyces blakesleeanus NRRL 1555(-)]|uniref:Uncharacterized protein n=1 Tax=Phycomyces blakesleeanus (strain ATCC 8743b / DSM 1359 / FGSC 10004 / NBRC 33097 / NRRL 1555) TaxID=763407 RepID=A0A162WI72_PHYB8|nr:hypothetical protein PHYBLDRAFT_151559 [Phycomyces blakesleeanus NRRL 1555(-)]OAD67305.1 hypothetical protein PHYBLDRAFT_151559 [Phycomyces blakesleeanus NRRL 1555(-)]|eukprot:XP_018285345.1 hypothetical protein PHYBLDRAFT_151559 [Phycomyces blakesleeanus NRRL 1555(-)]